MFFFKAFVVAATTSIAAQATPVASGDEALAPTTVGAVVPSPSPYDNSELFARADGNLYVCVNANFVGPCQNLSFNVGQCHNFGAPYQDSISSLGPDSGFRCFAYRDINCTGQSLAVVSPGVSNVNSVAPSLNDQISSY